MKRNINQAPVPVFLPENRGAQAMRVLLILSIAGQIVAPIFNPDNSNGFHDQAALIPGGSNFGMLPALMNSSHSISYQQYTGESLIQPQNSQDPNLGRQDDRSWEDSSRMVKLSGFGAGVMLQGSSLMLPGLNVALPRRALNSINEQMLSGADTISFSDRTGTRYLAEASQLASGAIADVDAKTADTGANLVVGLLKGYEQHFDGLFRPTKTEVLRNMADAMMGSDYALPEGGASSMMLEYINMKKPASISELKAVFLDTVLAASQVVRNADGSFTQFLDNGQSVSLDEDAAMDIFSESILYFGSEMASRKAVSTWNSMLDAVGLSDFKQQGSDDYDVPESKPASGLSNNPANLPEAVLRGPDFRPIPGMTVAMEAQALEQALKEGTLTTNYEYVIGNHPVNQSRFLNMPDPTSNNLVLYIRNKSTGNLVPQGALSDAIFEGLAAPLDLGGGNYDFSRIPIIQIDDVNFFNAQFANPDVGVRITGADIYAKQITITDLGGNPININSADYGSYNFRAVELSKMGNGRNYVIHVTDSAGNPVGILNGDSSFINKGAIDHNYGRHSVGFTFSELPEAKQVFTVIDDGRLTSSVNYTKLLSGQSVVIDNIEFSPVLSGGSPVGLGEGTNMVVAITNSAGETMPPVYIQQKGPGMNPQAFWMRPEEASMLSRMPQEYWSTDFAKIENRLANGGHMEIFINGKKVSITSLADLDAAIQNQANNIKLPGRTNPRLSAFSSFLNSKGVIYSFNFASYGLQGLDIIKPWIKAEINRPYVANSCKGDACDGASLEFWYPFSQMLLKSQRDMFNMYPATASFAEVDVQRLQNNPNDKGLYVVYLGDRAAFNDGVRPSFFGAIPLIHRSDSIASRFYLELAGPTDETRAKVNPVFKTPNTLVRVFNSELGNAPFEHVVLDPEEDILYDQFKVNIVDALPERPSDINPYDYPNFIQAQVVAEYLADGTPVMQEVALVALRTRSGQERVYILFEDGMSNLRASNDNSNLVAVLNDGK